MVRLGAIPLPILSPLVEEGVEWKVLVDHIIRMVLSLRFPTVRDAFDPHENCSHTNEGGNINTTFHCQRFLLFWSMVT